MKIAVVYNRDSRNVINLFGMPNREKIGLKTIKRLTNALKEGGHEVISLEGDKDLIDRLEEFMPRVVHGERPGMVFNVSYGLQGQARYTHVPSILEMVGVPYVASGPLGHSLSLDKVVTKMILRQSGLPTPDFAVLETPNADLPKLNYPVVVKPKNEAVSFGLKIVNNEAELREASTVIFDKFNQPVLAEQYIAGREVNVGLLGNNPPEALPPVELDFGTGGPKIYTYEDKTGRSGRTIQPICPAPIGEELTQKAKELAIRAFQVLGLYDCARVDMRLDKKGQLYILETNSLPSLGEHGSYLVGAAYVGLDFVKFVNRLVDVAAARYFGTPQPTALDTKGVDTKTHIVSYVTQRRREIERRLEEWTDLPSRTLDPIGILQGVERIRAVIKHLGMKPVSEFTDEPETYAWETARGFEGGTLLIGHLDVPIDLAASHYAFRREPEWLLGEGVGSRGPLVMMEYAFRSLRSIRRLRRLPVGVVLYTDEGRDARSSAEKIRAVAAKAKRVLVLRPGTVGEGVFVQRRGNRKFRFRVEGPALAPGRSTKELATVRWVWEKLERLARLSSQKKRISVSTLEMRTERHPMRLPHRVTATLLMTYPSAKVGDELEVKIRSVLGKKGPKWELVLDSDRPPMPERPGSKRLLNALKAVANEHNIPLKRETSTWPSVGGLVPARTACLCGIGPATRDRGTPSEAVQRISLIQRTILLAEFLAKDLGE